MFYQMLLGASALDYITDQGSGSGYGESRFPYKEIVILVKCFA